MFPSPKHNPNLLDSEQTGYFTRNEKKMVLVKQPELEQEGWYLLSSPPSALQAQSSPSDNDHTSSERLKFDFLIL